jgi:hypothetical protein
MKKKAMAGRHMSVNARYSQRFFPKRLIISISSLSNNVKEFRLWCYCARGGEICHMQSILKWDDLDICTKSSSG